MKHRKGNRFIKWILWRLDVLASMFQDASWGRTSDWSLNEMAHYLMLIPDKATDLIEEVERKQ